MTLWKIWKQSIILKMNRLEHGLCPFLRYSTLSATTLWKTHRRNSTVLHLGVRFVCVGDILLLVLMSSKTKMVILLNYAVPMTLKQRVVMRLMVVVLKRLCIGFLSNMLLKLKRVYMIVYILSKTLKLTLIKTSRSLLIQIL